MGARVPALTVRWRLDAAFRAAVAPSPNPARAAARSVLTARRAVPRISLARFRAMRIDHVGVLVEDFESAKAFARDVLGLGDPATEFEAPEHGLRGAFFGLGAARLELFTLEHKAPERLP